MSRSRFRYLNDDDASAVQLPAHYDAVPSSVEPGDVVEVNADAAELLDGDDRFEAVGDDVAISVPAAYPDRVADLKAWLEGHGVGYEPSDKLADLIDRAEAYVRLNPQPPGAAESVAPTPESPAVGDQVPDAESGASDTEESSQ